MSAKPRMSLFRRDGRRHHAPASPPQPRPTYPVASVDLPRFDAAGLFRFIDAQARYGAPIQVRYVMGQNRVVDIVAVVSKLDGWLVEYYIHGVDGLQSTFLKSNRPKFMAVARVHASRDPLSDQHIRHSTVSV